MIHRLRPGVLISVNSMRFESERKLHERHVRARRLMQVNQAPKTCALSEFGVA